MKSEGITPKQELDKRLTINEKRLLAKVLREKAMAAREKAKRTGDRYKKELRKALFTAFTAAFGFLIALVWRDAITEHVNNLVSRSPVQGQLISALIVTFICVLGILMVTKFLGEKVEEKK